MVLSTKILEQINKLTLQLETDYPELYSFIDEEPITIPSFEHPDITNKLLRDYLESLKGLIRSHKNN
ncbi:hypothetical protein C8P64_2248 [Christiangramia gaetbulicola]|uniref:Uncharacterized protein n=1 Tax=Christiangramia gaetbulicola TaxID=703340 RepID=A0A2T6AIY1_9FLAO|nr:hypothetical protein [Christiangramia gaetbulicola]PTX43716.1 hypothetical protein C8P64_2248 [Christiangramia gaetbulicola]